MLIFFFSLLFFTAQLFSSLPQTAQNVENEARAHLLDIQKILSQKLEKNSKITHKGSEWRTFSLTAEKKQDGFILHSEDGSSWPRKSEIPKKDRNKMEYSTLRATFVKPYGLFREKTFFVAYSNKNKNTKPENIEGAQKVCSDPHNLLEAYAMKNIGEGAFISPIRTQLTWFGAVSLTTATATFCGLGLLYYKLRYPHAV